MMSDSESSAGTFATESSYEEEDLHPTESPSTMGEYCSRTQLGLTHYLKSGVPNQNDPVNIVPTDPMGPDYSLSELRVSRKKDRCF